MTTAEEKLKAEKAKSYKTSHDVERAHYLIAAAKLMQDHPNLSPLQSSFVRELHAMNQKQVDMDAEEKAAEERAAKPNPPPAPEPEEEEVKHSSSRGTGRHR